jgi:hypothetical protein
MPPTSAGTGAAGPAGAVITGTTVSVDGGLSI